MLFIFLQSIKANFEPEDKVLSFFVSVAGLIFIVRFFPDDNTDMKYIKAIFTAFDLMVSFK